MPRAMEVVADAIELLSVLGNEGGNLPRISIAPRPDPGMHHHQLAISRRRLNQGGAGIGVRPLASFVRHQVLASALPVVGTRRKHGKPDFLSLPHRVRDFPRALLDVGAVRLLVAGGVDAKPALAVDKQPLALFLRLVGRLEEPLDAQLDVFIGPDDRQRVSLQSQRNPFRREDASEVVPPLQPQGRSPRRNLDLRYLPALRNSLEASYPPRSLQNELRARGDHAGPVAVLSDRVDPHPHQDSGPQSFWRLLLQAPGWKACYSEQTQTT